MHIVPKEGFRITDPETMRELSPEGREVTRANKNFLYWWKMVSRGDVVVTAAAEGEPLPDGVKRDALQIDTKGE